jgi:hypothetical protein
MAGDSYGPYRTSGRETKRPTPPTATPAGSPILEVEEAVYFEMADLMNADVDLARKNLHEARDTSGRLRCYRPA